MPGAPGTVYSKSIHLGGMAPQAGMEGLPPERRARLPDLHPSVTHTHSPKHVLRPSSKEPGASEARLWLRGILCGMEPAQARLEFQKDTQGESPELRFGQDQTQTAQTPTPQSFVQRYIPILTKFSDADRVGG